MINLILKVISALGLLILSPIILVAVIVIIIEDGVPAFFVQERLGKKMKVFKIYKIRTMYKNAPNLGTHEVNTSNYLKMGSLLRKLKIDELPQILNFIMGDLNLIGPRPGLPSQLELKKFRTEKKIFDVTPGISGLSQVLGYDMSNPYKLSQVDAIYIKEKSMKLDCHIFIATFINSCRKSLMLLFEKEISTIESGRDDV